MKRLILLLSLLSSTALGGVASVTVDANGNVLNTSDVKFATGKLKVNGVAVVGGGGTGDVTSAETSVTDGTPVVYLGVDEIRKATTDEVLQYTDPAYDFVAGYNTTTNLPVPYRFSDDQTLAGNSATAISSQRATRYFVEHFSVPWANIDLTTADLADFPTRLFSDLQGKPTTVAGYGITNGALSNSIVLHTFGGGETAYTTLALAKTAASSGDTIVVGPGTYTGNDLLKNGVNWHFQPGAIVSKSGDLSVGIFDDGGSAITSVITGGGQFSMTQTGATSFLGVVKTSNASSNVSITCDSLTVIQGGGGIDGNGAVVGFDGTLRVHANKITATADSYGVYWENGDTFVDVQTITGADGPTIASHCDDTPTGKLWVRADEVVATSTNSACSFADTNASAQVWIDALEIRSTGDGVSQTGAGKVYVTAEKISSSASAGVAVNNSGTGSLWLTAQKAAAGAVAVVSSSGTTNLQIEQYEEAGSSGNAFTVAGTATLNIWGGRTVFTHGHGLSISGGTARLRGATLDTSGTASKNPISKSGGTLILEGGQLIAEGASDSITAPTSQSVTAYGTTANRAANANITIAGDLMISGVHQILGGGTGVATFTAYAPIFGGTTATGALQSGTVGTSGQVLTSNGAGALPTFQAAGSSGAPTDATYITQTANGSLSAEQALSSLSTGLMKVTTTTGAVTSVVEGTGVETALGVNVGSAGAFVVNGGPLGTPSSGTGTNLTGIPESGVTSLTGDLALKAPLASPTFTGTVTLPSGQALIAPALGTPASGNFSSGTFTWPTFNQNTSGSAATVTTNANLTGAVTSSGNATSLGSFTFSALNTATTGDDAAGLAAANTFTGANIISTAGAASVPALKLSGVPFAGTGTTSFPLLYVNDANATASTTLSTAGTYLGVNGDGTQDLMNLLKDGTSQFKVNSTGSVTLVGNIDSSGGYISATGPNGFRWSNNGTRLAEYGDGKLRIRDSSDLSTVAHFLSFGLSTNSSPAIANDTVNSISIQSAAATATFNDPTTANSGTVSNRYIFGIAAPTLTSTGTSVTDTVASTVYIGGAPTASTNTTITTPYALNVAAGATNLGGSLKIGGGTAILKVLSSTATLDFASTAAGASADLTITVTGAALGDVVAIGVPNGSIIANSSYSGWVSATDTVTVRFVDNALVGTADPASGTFRAEVNQF